MIIPSPYMVEKLRPPLKDGTPFGDRIEEIESDADDASQKIWEQRDAELNKRRIATVSEKVNEIVDWIERQETEASAEASMDDGATPTAAAILSSASSTLEEVRVILDRLEPIVERLENAAETVAP